VKRKTENKHKNDPSAKEEGTQPSLDKIDTKSVQQKRLVQQNTQKKQQLTVGSDREI
jgi:hypothetical protein